MSRPQRLVSPRPGLKSIANTANITNNTNNTGRLQQPDSTETGADQGVHRTGEFQTARFTPCVLARKHLVVNAMSVDTGSSWRVRTRRTPNCGGDGIVFVLRARAPKYERGASQSSSTLLI